MNTWLFDLGNTRLKYARLGVDGSLGETAAVAHHGNDDWLQVLPAGDVACIASVGPVARHAQLMEAVAQRFGRLHRVRTSPSLGRLRIAYANPDHLGVDRFLAMLAAVDAIAGPVLVVGVGTALTCDLVDGAGRHLGGRIAPSPTLMRQALHARAAALPERGGRYAEFADETDHALVSGCDGAALALIERSLAHAESLLGAPPNLWLHGGGAGPLRDRLPAHDWVADAVVRGLARWHARCMP